MDVDSAVRERYSAAAEAMEPKLCCPVKYDAKYLKAIPSEIIEKDYGCGDPSSHLQEGDTVLDLGSGGGKICYIASQVVGKSGRVIGVDVNTTMLNLANKYKGEMGEKLGYSNVEFVRGRIQDLKLDLDLVDKYLVQNPIKGIDDMIKFEEVCHSFKTTQPLIKDNSIDCVVSNCVLNLVKDEDKKQLFAEIFRVLKKGGRAVISDVVSDEDSTEEMRNDPELWSGCISGAYREDKFLQAFEEAGFYGIEILKRDDQPWQVVNGIEFRSVTIRAWKGKQGPCYEKYQAALYRGPWKSVVDDDGHVLERGKMMAVCAKTAMLYSQAPYSPQVIVLNPSAEIMAQVEAQPSPIPFDCARPSPIRDPREMKSGSSGGGATSSCCGSNSCC